MLTRHRLRMNLLLVLAGVVFVFVAVTANAASGPVIGDKTLVAWVSPADLNQRGGSVLTIEKAGGVFDGIVFGELARSKWMAGSNFHERTKRQQDSFADETADAETFVQIAIVYKGKQITMYRNGRKYADYTAKNAEQFGPDSKVLIGLRHLDAHPGRRFFTGVIDDARIYNVALDEKTVASLKPNVESDPAPFAWWDFEGDTLADRMKAFSAGITFGKARIANGRLHLDKGGAYMLATNSAQPLEKALLGVGSPVDAARSLREKLLSDPHRPGFHLVIPEGKGMPFDPNGAIYWKGRYHVFFIFQDERTGRRDHHWGHVSSTDLFHWRFHETNLIGGMFSGNCFVNKDGVPTMCYHQVGQGNALAVALDDNLDKWEKLDSNPITPKTVEGDAHHGKYRSWDPYGWVEDDTYYAIFGGKRPAIVKSDSMAGPWKYVGDLMANSVGDVSINEDVSCADLFKIGDKRMLLCISHRLGCRYYLGRWEDEQFHPEFHEKMSWVDNSFFAPESLLDDKGRRIMWAWIFDEPGFGVRGDFGWSGTMSLPRVLSLADDGTLRMDVPKEIENLRYNPKAKKNITVKADSAKVLEGISGNSIELAIEMTSKNANQFGVKVCCSPDGAEETLIYYDAIDKKLKIDTRKSGLTGSPKGIEAGPFELKKNEALKLRVFVDKSVVEVFANGRQAVMRRIYPNRKDSVAVTLFSEGGPAHVKTVEAWDIMPSNPY